MQYTSLRTIPLDIFETLLKNSESISDFLRKAGFTSRGAKFHTFKRIVKENNFDTSHFASMASLSKRHNEYSEKEILELYFKKLDKFVAVKKYIIRFNLLPHKCKLCNLDDIWNNQKLVLQLDHINGDSTDNRMENLRFLCPNCHSQTSNFSGKKNTKNKVPKTFICKQCGVNSCCNSSRSCQSCAGVRNEKIKWPSNEELAKMVWQTSLSELSKKLLVTMNSIKHRCENRNIVLPPMGYWTRIQHGYSHEEALLPKPKKERHPFIPPCDDIKKILIESKETQRVLADRYGVSRKYIINLRKKNLGV